MDRGIKITEPSFYNDTELQYNFFCIFSVKDKDARTRDITQRDR